MKISNAIESYLNASNVHEPSTKEKKFYISDMGKCDRIRFLKRKGIGTEFTPYVNWIFKMGDLIHDFGYKALESQGLLLEAEDYVENDHFIGRFDGIVKSDAGKSVMDFKSANPYKLKKLIEGEEDEFNIAQLLTYVKFLKMKRTDISDTAYCVYINKEPSDQIPVVFFEKEYHLTKWRDDQIQEEMDRLVNFWEKDKIPPCTCTGWAKGPKYNSYFPLCNATEDKIKSVLEYLDAENKLVCTKEGVYLLKDKKRKEVLKG